MVVTTMKYEPSIYITCQHSREYEQTSTNPNPDVIGAIPSAPARMQTPHVKIERLKGIHSLCVHNQYIRANDGPALHY